MKMNSNKGLALSLSKGFTLIELLVVVAIIGILSSVVLASLNTARSKGADAAIKSELASIRAQAIIYYDNNGSYGTGAWIGTCAHTSNTLASTNSVFNDPNVKTIISQAGSMSGGVLSGSGGGALITNTYCYLSATGQAEGWVAVAQLKTSTTASPASWCVDGNGSSKSELYVVASAFNANSGTTPPLCK